MARARDDAVPCQCNAATDCVDSRPFPVGRQRRVRCRACGAKWSTLEVPRATYLQLAGALGAIRDGLVALGDAERALRGLQGTLDALEEFADGPVQ